MKLTKETAQAAYRAAWRQRCLAMTYDLTRWAERCMDAVQEDCVDARGPGPEWSAFIETLPGYVAFWDSFCLDVTKHAGGVR